MSTRPRCCAFSSRVCSSSEKVLFCVPTSDPRNGGGGDVVRNYLEILLELWFACRKIKGNSWFSRSVVGLSQHKEQGGLTAGQPTGSTFGTYLAHCLQLNPLNAEVNPICHLLTLLGAHPIFHISRISVNAVGETIQNTRAISKEMHRTQYLQNRTPDVR